MVGGSILEVGTATVSSPVSIPAMIVGAGSVAFGTIGLWEATNRFTGAIFNDKSLMNYDYLSKISEASERNMLLPK